MPSTPKPEDSEHPKKSDAPAPADTAVEVDDKNAGKDTNKALSLFEQQEKREATKGRKRTVEAQTGEGTGMLPPISKFQEGDSASAPAPVAEGDDDGEEGDDPTVIHIKPPIILKDLASRMEIKPFKIIQDLMELDVFASLDSSIEPDVAAQICEKHGFTFEKEKREKGGGVHKVEEVFEEPPPPPEPEVVEKGGEELPLRPPVVTVMGHVDHGKTSILDAIRSARVVAGEAGGITQHINAYSVEHGDARITFIDTPGHAAFTEMRARGANVTDIVVLVIAADDGIMPTTLEAINHARAAGVILMVAINKIDLRTADLNKVIGQLQSHDLTPEDWGGDTICVQTSAKENLGIDDLLDMIALQSEVLELRSNPDGPARGIVIEASSKAGKGATASILIQTGSLKPGDPFICGPYSGKVKLLLDDRGKQMKVAGPSMPVEVLGFSGVPKVGDELVVMDNERAAKKISEERLAVMRQEKLSAAPRTRLQDIFSSRPMKKTLNIVLKADVQGSVEAIIQSLSEIKSDKIVIEFLHSAAGPVTESDVLLGSASDAIIIGFGVKVESNALAAAKREGVEVRLYSIIYELIDQVREAMVGMLDIETREKERGRAEVKEVFKIKRGRVGGCIVNEGKINRKARARVIRDGQAVYDGGFVTLRRFQDDVDEVKTGLECGIRLGNYLEYEPGDIIQCYELEKLKQVL
jgi:translation initiation factor IF-2